MRIINRIKRKIKRIKENNEWKRLKSIPRYKPTSTFIIGEEFKMVDACTFIHGYQEIFEENIYKFQSAKPDPLIIDCGANIGLSVAYFKKIYPNSKLFAFEADPNIFSVLKENIASLNLKDVIAINKAVWINDKTTKFSIEGGFSGRIANHAENNQVTVDCIRLRNLLEKEIEFLKIDIEGAENQVIFDISDKLLNVKNLFIEYHSHDNDEQLLGEILNVLKKQKFRYHIKEAFTRHIPFINRDSLLGMDLQLNIFAYRQ